ncbi:MAG: OmpH family outer membrane protein [Bacteroidaceae bacterium]|nr:OmpH family outer membrane protein [Bacteroidaceae bacterium]
MKKLLFVTLFTLCASLSAFAQNPNTDSPAAHVVREYIRFGYFSYTDLLRNSPGYDIAQKKIADLRKVYEKELKRNEEQFSKQFAEYVEGQQTFPENILLKRQKELQQLMEQSMHFKQEAKQLLQASEEEVMAPLYKKLDDAIYKVGMERGYAYILNTDNKAYPFINGDQGEDVSAYIIEALK